MPPTDKKLLREYRCQKCESRLVEHIGDDGPYIACGRCGCTDRKQFVHEYEIERRRHNTAEALDSLAQSDLLPSDLAAVLGIQREAREPVLFSLCAQEIEI
jgi:DNA-directed RNA polymerase subunit RPC12/RpoP